VDIRSLRRFYGLANTRLGRIYGVAARPDFIAATAALFGVLIFDTLPGLFIGIVVSIILLVYRTSRPHVAVLGRVPGTTDQFADIERHTENRPVSGVVILRPESSLFFANAERIRDAIRSAAADPGTTAVILDLGTVPDVDLTAARMLADVREELAERGLRLLYARDVGQVRDMLGMEDAAGRVYPSIRAALDAVQTPPPPEAGP
jgi:SulP family sulfate permease